MVKDVALSTFIPVAHAQDVVSYKVTRLREMAALWKGTKLEARTGPLLAMLIVENGALSEAVRGDYGYAIGLDQTNLCSRGFLGEKYCGHDPEGWLKKKTDGTKYANYLTDWRVQFSYYTDNVLGMTNAGYTTDQIIRSWNSNEIGRRKKVKSHENFVKEALAYVI